MSYHYRIEPAITIVGEDLTNLQYALSTKTNAETVAKLILNGYYATKENLSPEEVSELTGKPVDGYKWLDAVQVFNMGWTPEREGLQGIADKFAEFAKFTGYNFPHGAYVITDDYDRAVTVTVSNSGCHFNY